MGEPTVEPITAQDAHDFTRVSFVPELSHFGCKSRMHEGTLLLMR